MVVSGFEAECPPCSGPSVVPSYLNTLSPVPRRSRGLAGACAQRPCGARVGGQGARKRGCISPGPSVCGGGLPYAVTVRAPPGPALRPSSCPLTQDVERIATSLTKDPSTIKFKTAAKEVCVDLGPAHGGFSGMGHHQPAVANPPTPEKWRFGGGLP